MSFTIDRGSAVGLVGPNGAGKTTLIKIIVGFLREDSGKIHIKTTKPLGYVQEVPMFFNDLTVEDNLKYISEINHVPIKRIEDYLRKFGLGDKKRDYPTSLSKGQRKRLAIIRAILHDPEFIVMDEPFSGLDPSMAIGIRKIVESLREEKRTIFISSHNLLYLTPICDRVIFMKGGKVLGDYHFKNKITLKIIFKGKIPEDMMQYIERDGELLIETDRENVPDIIRKLVHSGIDIYEAKMEGLDAIYEKLYRSDIYEK